MRQHIHDGCEGHCTNHENHGPKEYTRFMLPLTTVILWLAGWGLQEAGLIPVEAGWGRFVWYLAAWLPVSLPVLSEAWEAVKEKDFFNEFTLMLMASVGAFYIGEYPEAVAVMLFYSLGELFQDRAVDKAKKHIQSLLDVRPSHASVCWEGSVHSVSPEEVRMGEVIEVKAGERVPLDGVMLTSERVAFNTAALTGESVPRHIGKGEEVLSGMIPVDSVVRLRTVREYSDSALSRILDMVQNAASHKAPTERFIRKFARIYTPCVTVLAVLLVVIPWIYSLMSNGFAFDFHAWLYRSLVFLVVSCPCALVVSIPLSYFGGIGAASKAGILFKGGTYLDEIARVNTVFFDKTGTLTKGVFRVQEVRPAKDVAVERLIAILAGAESASTHPIAQAILAYSKKNGITPFQMSNVKELAGHGICAGSKDGEVRVGKPALLKASGVSFPSGLENVPETIVAASLDGHYLGCVLLADEIKEDSRRLSDELRALGVNNLCILSGDKSALVRKLAKELGMTHCFGDLLPEDKVHYVEESQHDRRNVVAFVGDGLNDAPVLAVSRIGIAMGGLGSDVAIEAADVILQTDQPSKIADAVRIGRRTHAIVWQNISLAVGIKVLVLLLGALGMATLWEAVFADVGVTLLAVLNTVRLLKFRTSSGI